MTVAAQDTWGFDPTWPLPRSAQLPPREPDDLRTTMHGFDEFFRYAYFLTAWPEPGAKAPTTTSPAALVRSRRFSAGS